MGTGRTCEPQPTEESLKTQATTGGSDGRRSRDLTIFSRALYQLSYRAVQVRHGHLARDKPCLATLTGLEPATSAVTGRRANQLRYRAMRIQLWVMVLVVELVLCDMRFW